MLQSSLVVGQQGGWGQPPSAAAANQMKTYKPSGQTTPLNQFQVCAYTVSRHAARQSQPHHFLLLLEPLVYTSRVLVVGMVCQSFYPAQIIIY